MTFTIIGIDKKNKEIGIACFSKALSVGGCCPAVDLNSGAVGTQAYPNVLYKEKALNLMKKYSPDKVISMLIKNDPEKQKRQVLIMNSKGQSSAFTGNQATGWKGSLKGKDCICAGNTLKSEKVLIKMTEAFEKPKGSLAERLISALIAGHNVGGDKRIRVYDSASLIVEKPKGGIFNLGNRYLDLRIDLSKNSIKDLNKLLKMQIANDKYWEKREKAIKK